MNKPDKWKIRITGYGTFDFEGTESEAEKLRAGKAQWERGSGMMWRVTNPTLVDKLRELMAWYFDNEGGCPSWVCRKLSEAKKLEVSDGKS